MDDDPAPLSTQALRDMLTRGDMRRVTPARLPGKVIWHNTESTVPAPSGR